jgi:hypothetical protein
VNESGMLTCLVGLFLSEVTANGISLLGRHNAFGWTLIVSVILTIFFNLVIAIVELYQNWKNRNKKPEEDKPSNLKSVLEKRR